MAGTMVPATFMVSPSSEKSSTTLKRLGCEAPVFRPGVKIIGAALQFDREYVRSLTPKELKECLAVLVERLVASADAKKREVFQ